MLDRIAARQHIADTGPLWLYPFLVAAVAAPASLPLLLIVLSGPLEKPFAAVPNPVTVRWPHALGFLRLPVWLAVFASLFVGAAAVRSRYRRSVGIDRLQMLWLAYASLLVPSGVICWLVWGLVFGEAGNPALAFLLATEAAVALALSTRRTRAPPRARWIAVAEPAGPAPTTSTS